MSEKEFELYLELLSRFLKLRPGQRAEIADELRDHLEFRLEELSRAGVPRDEAIKQALGEFGDASDLAEHFARAANERKRRFLIRATLGTVAGVAAMILIATALWPEPAGNVPQVAVAQQNDEGPQKEEFLYGGKTFDEWKRIVAVDLEPATRIRACEAFGAFGTNGYGKGAIEVLGAVLTSKQQYSVQKEAFDALTRIGAQGFEDQAAAVSLAFLDTEYAQQRDPASNSIAYELAFMSLQELGAPALPALLQLLKHDRPDNRRAAASRLEKFRPPIEPDDAGRAEPVYSQLLAAAADESPKVRAAAIHVLVEWVRDMQDEDETKAKALADRAMPLVVKALEEEGRVPVMVIDSLALNQARFLASWRSRHKKTRNPSAFCGVSWCVGSSHPYFAKGFRVKTIIQDRMEDRKSRLDQRLDKHNYPDDLSRPVIRGQNIHYELAGRAVGTAYGGIGLVQQLVRHLGLAQAIDSRLHLFKVHLPYHESDHVLNLAYNALCCGTCLEDLELRRQDEAYLNLLGAERIPDPTTAGDFCRRFQREHLQALQEAYDVARRKVWREQPAEFFAEARIEADGTIVETDAECKKGIDYSYKGVWGYHPLLLTLANTGEVLRLVNRSGNRPSHEGAAVLFDECIGLCREAGFQRILLRGDTDFSQTAHLDRWHAEGDVRFIFGLDVTAGRHVDADDLPASAWKSLKRPPKYEVLTEPRAKPTRFKQRIVDERQFKDIRLISEEVAEMAYRPVACQHTYRLVIVRKNLRVSDPKQQRLFDDYRYFLYITNDWASTPAEIVFSANDRCQQENILAQLAALRALHAPVDNLHSNEAYMLMTALGWNLKAWVALALPEEALRGESSAKRGKPAKATSGPSVKRRLLGMEYRTFVNYFLRIPAQVVTTGRRIVVRLLAYNHWQPVFIRLSETFARPRRC